MGIQEPTSSMDHPAPLSPVVHHEDDPWTGQQATTGVPYDDTSPFAESGIQ